MKGVQERPKVVFCTPTVTKPYDAYLAAMEASEPLLKAAGFDCQIVFEVGSPYISSARSTLLRKALDGGADIIVFLDHDLSWRPQDLLSLVQAPEPVVAGLYRFKKAEEEFMGSWLKDREGRPVGKAAGDLVMIEADRVPAGFLKITKEAVDAFMKHYPSLCYGPRYRLSVDLFNHGAHDGVWWGEDYAFCRNWRDIGGQIWVLPELQLTHHGADGTAYPGDLDNYLRRQPGGDLEAA